MINESQAIECLVLRRWDYGEKDQIISLLSREKGRIQGIAKGAKASLKRFGPALDLFSWIRVQIKERKNSSLLFIEQAQVISNFPKLRQDYASILIASGLLDLSHALFKEGVSEEGAFQNLLESLTQLENNGAKRRVFWSFLIKSLELLGWGLHLNQCKECKRSLKDQSCLFDAEHGLVFCENCKLNSPRLYALSRTLTSWMRDTHQDCLFTSQDEALMQELLEKYCQQHLHLEPDWNRFLKI